MSERGGDGESFTVGKSHVSRRQIDENVLQQMQRS